MLPPPLCSARKYTCVRSSITRNLCNAAELTQELPSQNAFLQSITSFLSKEFNAPISLITTLDYASGKQHLKFRYGLDSTETNLSDSFCKNAVAKNDVFIVPDALKHDKFKENNLVLGDPNIRFYCGVPLVLDGVACGGVCVIDRVPRYDITESQVS